MLVIMAFGCVDSLIAQTPYTFVREGYEYDSRDFNANFEIANDSVYTYYLSKIALKWELVLAKGALSDLKMTKRHIFTSDTVVTSLGWFESAIFDHENQAIVAGFSTVNSDNNDAYGTDASIASFHAGSFKKNFVKQSRKYGRDYHCSSWVDADGNYLLCGYSQQLDTSKAGGMFLTKMTPDGDTIWERVYNTQGVDIGLSIEDAPDGGYYLFGNTNGHVLDPPYGFDARLYRLDSVGNIVWQKTWGGIHDDDAWGLEYKEGIGLLTIGSLADINEVEDLSRAQVRLLDDDGEEIWSYTVSRDEVYEGKGARKFFGGRLLEDGTAIIYGSGTYSEEETLYGPTPYLYFFTNEGELEYKRAYTSWFETAIQGLFQDIHVFETGEILVSGTYFANGQDTGDQDIFFAVLDSAGCEYPGCRPPLSVVKREKTTQQMRLYPNPVDNRLHLRISDVTEPNDIQVVNMLGEVLIENTSRQDEVTMDVSQLPIGTYILTVKTEGSVAQKKFVISR